MIKGGMGEMQWNLPGLGRLQTQPRIALLGIRRRLNAR